MKNVMLLFLVLLLSLIVNGQKAPLIDITKAGYTDSVGLNQSIVPHSQDLLLNDTSSLQLQHYQLEYSVYMKIFDPKGERLHRCVAPGLRGSLDPNDRRIIVDENYLVDTKHTLRKQFKRFHDRFYTDPVFQNKHILFPLVDSIRSNHYNGDLVAHYKDTCNFIHFYKHFDKVFFIAQVLTDEDRINVRYTCPNHESGVVCHFKRIKRDYYLVSRRFYTY